MSQVNSKRAKSVYDGLGGNVSGEPGLNDLFQSNILTAEQWHERNKTQRTGVQKLSLAVLLDAYRVSRLDGPALGYGPVAKLREITEARTWILEDEETLERPFSFRWCCRSLNVNVAYLRRKMSQDWPNIALLERAAEVYIQQHTRVPANERRRLARERRKYLKEKARGLE